MRNKSNQLNPENFDILGSPACMQYINLAKSRKRPKLTRHEYEKLRIAYVDYYFSQRPEINRRLFSSWGHANDARSILNCYLSLQVIIVLPEEIAQNLHGYNISGCGLSRLTSLVRKIKLKQKINKDGI